jgi:prepilin-type N-terminal cleavage/methylation domain-containing protein
MRGARGFTLLEIIVAVAIFAFISGAAMQTMSSSDHLAGSAMRARDLRMLAERKLGEALTFDAHYEAEQLSGDFKGYDEFKDRFDGWTWQVETRDVWVFGIASDENAEYLFGAPTEDEKAAQTQAQSGAQSGQPGQPAKKSEPRKLREITVRVASPSDDGTPDSVELIMFAPPLERQGVTAPKQGG